MADLEIRNLHVRAADKDILKGLDLTASKGEIHALMGPDDLAAIEAKDSAGFVKGFNALTAACNACHQGIGRGFVVIQVPAVSPFSD